MVPNVSGIAKSALEHKRRAVRPRGLWVNDADMKLVTADRHRPVGALRPYQVADRERCEDNRDADEPHVHQPSCLRMANATL